MSSVGAMLPSVTKETLFEFLPVEMKGSGFNLYLPQVDVDGWPQYANASALAIDVETVPFETAC